MHIEKTVKDMQVFSRSARSGSKTIGFVPTMGALHEGHLSLVSRSVENNDITVVSIFVNPAQFGPGEDFKQYPRDIERDLNKLSARKVDKIFLPDIREIYPDGFEMTVNVGHIGETLCGSSRPGHFNGVATVIAKFLNIVIPSRIYLGQKDFQQTVVIKKLASDLNFDTDVIVCPTIRDPDGLAMSSRNSYLNSEERKAATVLYRAVITGEKLIRSGGERDASIVKKEMVQLINSEPLVKIEYVEIVHVRQLDSVEKIVLPVAICIAVKVGRTRLIDNVIVNVQSGLTN